MSQYHDRGIGLIKEPFEIVSNIARVIRPDLPDEMIEEAVVIRSHRFRQCVVRPEDSVIAVLRQLKAQGYGLCLISNADVIDIMGWSDSPLSEYFDRVLFSCEIGLAKPDPAIYHRAMDDMQVKPEDSVFVGDGGSDELAGARRVGMTTVLTTQYRWQKDAVIHKLRQDADYIIHDLEELLK